MKQEEKASLMRVLTDLVKADGIIDINEMDCLDHLREQYKITHEDECRAENITFAAAIQTLTMLDAEERQQMMGDFTKVAMSDNHFVRSEALLMLALHCVLLDDEREAATVLSVNNDLMRFDENQLLYVEAEAHESIHQQVDAHYEELQNMIRLAGLDFVYIPRLSAHYGSLDKEALNNMVKFLYPKASAERIAMALLSLCSMQTHVFCRELLSAKLGLREMSMVSPSVMIKVGESVTDGEVFSHFLLFEVGNDMVQRVKKLLGIFAQYYSNLQLNYLHEQPERFVYKGFYRQVFDLLMLQRGIKSTVVIDAASGNIKFPDADLVLGGVHRREKALYALFLLESVHGGINFTLPTGKQRLEVYNRRMAQLMQKYRLIYVRFGGEASKAPNICDYSTRGPMIALLKRQILSLKSTLHHADSYCIMRNSFGNYSVDIPSTMCYSLNVDGQLSLLHEDEEWQHIAAL